MYCLWIKLQFVAYVSLCGICHEDDGPEKDTDTVVFVVMLYYRNPFKEGVSLLKNNRNKSVMHKDNAIFRWRHYSTQPGRCWKRVFIPRSQINRTSFLIYEYFRFLNICHGFDIETLSSATVDYSKEYLVFCVQSKSVLYVVVILESQKCVVQYFLAITTERKTKT